VPKTMAWNTLNVSEEELALRKQAPAEQVA